ncbi:hypothetical protein FACS1894182_08440 [Bacteroidia bacterium]|nr:hypothetical protein FACS1894182_08440 [Bacteroidia bacterium]
MNTKEQIEAVRYNWLRASQELGFRIVTPYIFTLNEVKHEAFAFLPEYGSPNGIIIDLMMEPNFETNEKVEEFAQINTCFYSFIGVDGFPSYNKDFIIDCLEDWGKFQ